ncbi:hypothetical protein [Natronorubrum thiooxidans]|uniref:Uncharacterized protein n=1 Tax=Natronorubrum thiooxidans TaxID=308853 RepID=A0A1N7HAJ3_9EURY|nr:hypothetical protein [Natronorubrum thiooxidans]SIS21771.1 hypothetical protein SAMN05421752_14015 [Natronorubrum thiooxidans]
MTAKSERHYPKNASIRLAARDDTEAYYFKTPTGGVMQVPAMNAEQARQLAADEYHGFGPDDFEQVDGFDHAHLKEYSTPLESGRPVNEHDIWMLRAAMRTSAKRYRKLSNRRNPTDRMLEAVLDEWDDPDEIPLADVDALQQADGIGPSSAGRIVGAALANELVERPTRGGE